jgi:hypothetical protein
MTAYGVYSETPTQYAWKLIKNCPWVSKSNEKFAVLCLAAEMESSGLTWIPVEWVATRSGWSPQNAKDQLERPRNDDKIVTKTAKGEDGKERTYYSLKGWE